MTELQAGRPNAAESTFRMITEAVGAFARAMFKKYPRVGRFVDVDDVIQGSLVRLLPASRRHFYALANELIRRELLDLVKHYYGPRGPGTNLADVPVGEADGEHAPPAAAPAAAELDRWAAFHAAVEALPAEQREVFGL